MDDFIQDLNDAQRACVEHEEGPLLVIAGAGTGKTRVITHRIARLIEKGVEPESILALTFTEKAAHEMEERVDRLVPYGYTSVWISTFHSFGDRVLRDNALSISLAPDFKVLSTAECVIFLKEHIYELPLKRFRPISNPTKFVDALVRFIGRLKDEVISPEDYLDYCSRLEDNGDPARKDYIEEQTELAHVYAKYTELMNQHGYMDHGDQIINTLKLFLTRPAILERYRNRFRYILADEFQDTNYAQFELLKLLAGERKNLMVVADDDQSIYKFRGAAISNVLSFQNVFPETKVITLTRNYRSVQPILDASYRLINHNNPDRLEVRNNIDKRLVSEVGTGGSVYHRHFDTLTAEAEFVAETICERVKEDEARFSDFAVLVRANLDAAPYLRALDQWGVPYRFSGNSGLYSREEIQMLIGFLKVITDYSDSVSLFELARSKVYGLGPRDLVECNTIARRTRRPLFKVMSDIVSGAIPGGDLTPKGLETIKRLVSDIESYGGLAFAERTGKVLYAFLTESGYIQTLVNERSERAQEEVKNIARFLETVTRIEDTLSINRASRLVDELRLLIEAGEDPGVAEPDPESDAVQVLTVHKAKGLEFPVVFMVGLVTDRFPRRDRRDLLEVPEELIKEILPSGNFHLQEERRLFYVGMTRAQRELFLTSASDYGGVRPKKVSRFVLEALDTPKAETIKTPPEETIRMLGTRGHSPKGARLSTDNGTLALSHYQVDDYLTCPLKYSFVHLYRVPLLPHHTIIYGKSVHEAVSLYFRKRLDEGVDATEEELIGAFKASWSSEGFISLEHERQRFNEGIEGLKRFLSREKERNPKPLIVERDFSIDIDEGLLLRGRWDLIERRDDGDYIVDFKTSEVKEQKKADKKARESLQLLLYTLAYKKCFNTMPAGCELRFFESGLTGSVRFREKDLEKAEATVKEVAEGIRRKDFSAKPDYLNCSWCAFNNICPDAKRR